MKFFILGNSITYNLHVRGARTISISGLDWQGAKNYIMENRESMKNSFVYIVVGPVRFTSMHHSRKEVALVKPTQSVRTMFTPFYTEFKSYNIRPIIATLYPMIFTEYNRKKARRPIMTAFYKEWDDLIRRYVVVENRDIIEFNKKWHNQTPYLHRRVYHRQNGYSALRANLLTDGLHPKHVVKNEWARELRRVIKNLN